jgi:hypothetical protein
MVWTYEEYQSGRFVSSWILHCSEWWVVKWCFKGIDLVRFEVFPAVLMNIYVFWDVTLCWMVDNYYYRKIEIE